MRSTIAAILGLASLTAAGAALAQTKDAPASPSGAPAAAAENGSSEAGVAGSKNEMSSHESNAKSQAEMANPHKESR